MKDNIKNKVSCGEFNCYEDGQSFYVNGKVPHMAYSGLSIQQHHNIVENFYKLISDVRPSQIIEIGTAAGGLTLMLRDILDAEGMQNTELITYDPTLPNYLLDRIEKDNLNIKYKSNNIFSGSYLELENEAEIKDLIQGKGTTILLCDGGSKKNEFRLLSPLLKSGDIIMAHDYAPNQEYFNNFVYNKVWYWLEIQDSDIEQSCVNNNLVPHMDEEFKNVVWVCRKKI